ncbi:MAG: GDSL-type esterase/lipase family protein [Kiritimatiellales bacterium]
MRKRAFLFSVVLLTLIESAVFGDGFIAVTNRIALSNESSQFVRLRLQADSTLSPSEQPAIVVSNSVTEKVTAAITESGLDATLVSGPSNLEKTIEGTQPLLLEDNSQLQIDFNPAYEDEIVCFEFDVQVEKIANTIASEQNYLGTNEVFQLRVGEQERLAAVSPYSAKFNILKASAGKVSFTGYDRSGSPNYTDTAKSSFGGTEFDATGRYHVKLSYSNYRVYIDVNDGELTTSFSSARQMLNDARLCTRAGCAVRIENFHIYGEKNSPKPISEEFQGYLTKKLLRGYTDLDYNYDGVSPKKLTLLQSVRYGVNRNSVRACGLRFDAFTDTRSIAIDYRVEENGFPAGWPTQFDVFINGKKQTAPPTVTTQKLKSYTLNYTLPESAAANNRLTVMFPPSVGLAITDIRLDKGSRAKPVELPKKLLVIGDSITAGAQCESPAATFAAQVSMAYNMELLNIGVGGSSFDYNKVVAGDFKGFEPDVILFAWGINSLFADRNSLSQEIPRNIAAIQTKFPAAKIVAMTPIWRHRISNPDEDQTELDYIEFLKTVYNDYSEITRIDCYDFVTHDASRYNPGDLLIHPNTLGQTEYGTNLISALEATGEFPLPDPVDWAALADEALAQ